MTTPMRLPEIIRASPHTSLDMRRRIVELQLRLDEVERKMSELHDMLLKMKEGPDVP